MMNSSDGSKKNKIVCRYGPSPTGNLHIGSARTALFIYLFAKSRGGKFLLRIDDTDLIKSNYDYTNEAIECLKWLGIKWDIGPIYQSRRFEIYKKYIQQLIDTGHAYYDESDKGKAVRFKMPAKKVEFIDLIHGTIKDDLSRIRLIRLLLLLMIMNLAFLFFPGEMTFLKARICRTRCTKRLAGSMRHTRIYRL